MLSKGEEASMEPVKKTRTKLFFSVVGFLLVAIPCARTAAAADGCEPAIAQIVSLQGQVEIQRAGQASWVRVTRLDERLCQGDRLRSGARSRAALLIGPQTLIRVD